MRVRSLGAAILLAGPTLGCASASISPVRAASAPPVNPERAAIASAGLSDPDAQVDPRSNARDGESSGSLVPGHAYARGTTRFESYVSAIGGDPGKGEMVALHAGAETFLRDYVGLSATLFGAYVRSGIDDNGGAGGFDFVLRRHVTGSTDAPWSFFADAGAGCQQQSTNFSGPRHFNFRLIVGVGATLALGERWGLIAGIRYLHISDAGIRGGGGGYDGPMGYAGLTFGPGSDA